MALLKLNLVILSYVFVVGCTATSPYRSAEGKDCTVISYKELTAHEKCSNIEKKNDNNKFDLGIVEFSDQGMMYERKQFDNVLQLVKAESEKDLEIVVYVHGWKHSADFEDKNFRKFQKDIMPNFVREGTRTVGLYVGWRGKVLKTSPVLQSITFYDRKNAADKVAKGSVRELFSYLSAYRNNELSKPGRKVKLTIIGHSFGGLIIYNSLAEVLMNSVVEANLKNPQTPRNAKPIADLILLLNPAFEASRFEPLFQAAKDKLKKNGDWLYDAKQQPILISITSEADLATKYAFPVVRTLNSIFEQESQIDEDVEAGSAYWNRIEKIANTRTVGHIERYRTHMLDFDSELKEDYSNVEKYVSCLTFDNKFIVQNNQFPLWNIYATKNVIPGHDNIYEKPLWSFISKIAEVESAGKDICK